jgi:hypothetical protein
VDDMMDSVAVMARSLAELLLPAPETDT